MRILSSITSHNRLVPDILHLEPQLFLQNYVATFCAKAKTLGLTVWRATSSSTTIVLSFETYTGSKDFDETTNQQRV